MSVEKAADKVNISKKQLDDYLSHLRSAKRFGFDFNRYGAQKFGAIRKFVKSKKAEAKQVRDKENNAAPNGIRKRQKDLFKVK